MNLKRLVWAAAGDWQRWADEHVSEMAAVIDDFCADGFLVVRGAVAPDVVRACVNVIENELRARSVDPHDPATWTEPVVRFPCPDGPAFAAAGTSPALWRMYDALLGE